jgi:glycosyltransferase involved in cell wall biosynthesis
MQQNSTHTGRFVREECCVIIPTFNNEETLANIINRTLSFTSRIIVIDDGSTDSTPEILKQYPSLKIVTLPYNKGKGYAIRKGFDLARGKGYRYAITIDSDGQHQPEDLPHFLDKIEKEPGSLIVGARNLDQIGIPRGTTFGNRVSNFWYWIETGLKLPDTQSGYRLYPLEPLGKMKFFTRRFEFEVEVLVRAEWKDIPIVSIPVAVQYPEGGRRVSHFRPVRDFMRISLLNTILVLVSFLFVKPFKVMQNLNRENISNFLKKELMNHGESNFRKAASVSLGIFMGIAPIWGWQTAASIGLAVLLRLNKMITVVAANISIPPMLPLILYASYKTGGLILQNHKDISYSSGITLKFVEENFIQYILGALVFGLVFSIFCGLVTYFILTIFRKKQEIIAVQVEQPLNRENRG